VSLGTVGDVGVYTISSAGKLEAILASPFSPATAGFSNDVLVSANQAKLFESRFFEGVISGWSIGSDGSLSELPSSPFATVNSFNFISGVATNKTGTRLHVSLASSSLIDELGINSDGSLYPIASTNTGQFTHGYNSVAVFPPKTCPAPWRAGDACINRQNARGEVSSLTHGTSRGRIYT